MPLAFSTGNTGRLFTEFALAVAAAVAVSGFVALTLTPMMCSKLLRHQAKHNAIFNFTERMFDGLNRGTLAAALRHRWVVVVGVLVGTFLTMVVIPTSYTLLVERRRTVLEGEDAVHAAAS